jgi:hypothetical protein
LFSHTTNIEINWFISNEPNNVFCILHGSQICKGLNTNLFPMNSKDHVVVAITK